MIAKFNYMNHRGETRLRTVNIAKIEFLANPAWGYQPGWFLTGIDVDKGEHRSFALNRIVFDEPQGPVNMAFVLDLAALS